MFQGSRGKEGLDEKSEQKKNIERIFMK